MEKYFFISLLTTFVFLIILRPIAVRIGLVDFPSSRKKHVGEIPLTGGICIYLGVLITHLYLNELNTKITILLISSLLIIILGIYDDLYNLKAKIKLFIQFIIVTLTVFLLDLKIENLDQILRISHTLNLGIFSIPLTILAVVALTNAFNMIDGIDGQAGIMSIISIMGIFFYGLHLINGDLFLFLLSISASVISFLIFNLTSNINIKAFLGDGGSLFLGLTISLALIYCIQNINFFSSFAFWCVAIPIFDFFSVIILRKLENRSITLADRDHIHHFLESLNLNKKFILLFLSGVGLILLLLGLYLEKNFPTLSIWIFITLFFLYLGIRIITKIKKKK